MTYNNGANQKKIGTGQNPLGFKDVESSLFAHFVASSTHSWANLHFLDSFHVTCLDFWLVIHTRPFAILDTNGLVVVIDESVWKGKIHTRDFGIWRAAWAFACIIGDLHVKTSSTVRLRNWYGVLFEEQLRILKVTALPISRKCLNSDALFWKRKYLLSIIQAGKVWIFRLSFQFFIKVLKTFEHPNYSVYQCDKHDWDNAKPKP